MPHILKPKGVIGDVVAGGMWGCRQHVVGRSTASTESRDVQLACNSLNAPQDCNKAGPMWDGEGFIFLVCAVLLGHEVKACRITWQDLILMEPMSEIFTGTWNLAFLPVHTFNFKCTTATKKNQNKTQTWHHYKGMNTFLKGETKTSCTIVELRKGCLKSAGGRVRFFHFRLLLSSDQYLHYQPHFLPNCRLQTPNSNEKLQCLTFPWPHHTNTYIHLCCQSSTINRWKKLVKCKCTAMGQLKNKQRVKKGIHATNWQHTWQWSYIQESQRSQNSAVLELKDLPGRTSLLWNSALPELTQTSFHP